MEIPDVKAWSITLSRGYYHFIIRGSNAGNYVKNVLSLFCKAQSKTDIKNMPI